MTPMNTYHHLSDQQRRRLEEYFRSIDMMRFIRAVGRAMPTLVVSVARGLVKIALADGLVRGSRIDALHPDELLRLLSLSHNPFVEALAQGALLRDSDLGPRPNLTKKAKAAKKTRAKR